jgi:hypothetical protein
MKKAGLVRQRRPEKAPEGAVTGLKKAADASCGRVLFRIHS